MLFFPIDSCSYFCKNLSILKIYFVTFRLVRKKKKLKLLNMSGEKLFHNMIFFRLLFLFFYLNYFWRIFSFFLWINIQSLLLFVQFFLNHKSKQTKKKKYYRKTIKQISAKTGILYEEKKKLKIFRNMLKPVYFIH